jgi:hypothetical protein
MILEQRKMISVKKMKEILNTLPDTDFLCAQTLGNTGNIGVFHNFLDGVIYASIDVKDEVLERYDD